LYGGFAGTETDLSQRTPSVIRANPTILSGDFNNDDLVTGSGSTLNLQNYAENATHVVIAYGLTLFTYLDGFTITGGAGGGGTVFGVGTGGTGGGIYVYNADLHLSIHNCIITKNGSLTGGGGIAMHFRSSPQITNTVFDRNSTLIRGGAFYLQGGPNTNLTNCVFSGNYAGGRGGAIVFENILSGLTIRNCTMSGNYGVVNDCIYSESNFTIINSIIHAGSTFGIYTSNTLTMSHSFYSGNDPNNLLNPRFKNVNNPIGDDGVWLTNDDGLQLACESPAFNTGTNTGAPITDVLNNARPQFSTVDMGAYESTIDLTNPIQNISFSGATTACREVNLTATTTPNLGAGGQYAWSGGSTPTVASNTFTTSGTYSVTVTAGNGCTATASQAVTIVQPITPMVSIAVSPSNSIASGTNTTFTATPTNGGTTPQYQWYLNNNAVGTNSATYSNASLANGDIVRCVLTTSETCITATTANSNAITMIVYNCGSLTRLYVKPTASGTGDGTSWTNAMSDLGAALFHVCNPTEIWVAAGTYKPTRNENGVIISDNTRTFLIPNGVKVYGGFAGTETDLSQRTPSVIRANPTILSGDFSNNDLVTGTGSTLSLSNYGDNAYHVVAFFQATTASRLDGFIVTGGSGGGGNIFGTGWGNLGGGIWIANTDAIALSDIDKVIIENCIISKNGAVYGGGIFCQRASPTIRHCVFDRNSGSINHGGGMVCFANSKPTLTNCIFSGNYARIVGGGIANFSGSAMTMINSTMSGNYAQAGGGFYNDNSNATILNSIIWNNTADGLNNFQSTPSVSNSILQAAFSGNSIQNPQFIDAANPVGADGLWGTADDGLRLACHSPARDSGIINTTVPTIDITYAATFNSLKDLGAYEKQDNNGCAIYVGSATCQSVTVNNVSGVRLYNFFINNQLVATLNPNGQNLGNVTVEIGDPTGATLHNNIRYLGRHINITSTNAPTAGYTLSLYYKDSELTELNTAGNTSFAINRLDVVWKREGSGCDWANYTSTNTGTVFNGTITAVDYGINSDGFYLQFHLNHFTIFAAKGTEGALPIELLTFSGKNTEGGNLLTWTTASETNNKGFDIERSQDGKNFTKIGWVDGHGTTRVITHYNFMDNTSSVGIHYYRLKQWDFDGEYHFSKVIALNNDKQIRLTIYPNPTDGLLNILTNHEKEIPYSVSNMLGCVVKTGTVKAQVTLDVSELATGTYFIKCNDKVVKFVKNQ
jgi:hypothetical protein